MPTPNWLLHKKGGRAKKININAMPHCGTSIIEITIITAATTTTMVIRYATSLSVSRSEAWAYLGTSLVLLYKNTAQFTLFALSSAPFRDVLANATVYSQVAWNPSEKKTYIIGWARDVLQRKLTEAHLTKKTGKTCAWGTFVCANRWTGFTPNLNEDDGLYYLGFDDAARGHGAYVLCPFCASYATLPVIT